MRDLRQAAGVSLSDTAGMSGWDVRRLSNAELGGLEYAPTYEMVAFYEERFGGKGVLWELFRAMELERRARDPRRGPRANRKISPQNAASPKAVGYPRDRSVFLRDVTVPDDTLMRPGQAFVKAWEILNAGEILWSGRFLTRQGPHQGPETMQSPRSVPIPETPPGGSVEIAVTMRAPLVDGAAVSIWKMADEEGRLYFPDTYTMGLICQIFVLAKGSQASLGDDRLRVVRQGTAPAGPLAPDTPFTCFWVVRNEGTAIWEGRLLRRVTPAAGPGTMRSPLAVPVSKAGPGEEVQIEATLQTSHIEGTSVSYWMMTDEAGRRTASNRQEFDLMCEMTVVRPHRRHRQPGP